jgi:hypothetical protein
MIEEKAGRQFQDDMTPAKAAGVRARRIEGKEPSNKEQRQAERAAKEGLVNKEAVKVYLRSLELTVNLLRAGNVAGLAISEADKREKSLSTRELKKVGMRYIIDNIFKKNPHRPKTLGEVWNKIERGYEGIRLTKTKKEYIAKTGKDAKGEKVVFIIGDVPKPFKYAKRSLQHFIDELK